MNHPAIASSFDRGEEIDFKAVFDKLFRRYFFPLCAYCQHKYGLDLPTSKDVVHQAFLKLWETHRADATEQTLIAYLYTLLNHFCLNLLAHHRMKQKHEKIILRNSPLETLDNTEVRLLVKEIGLVIEQLPDQMRQVFQLSRYEGLTYRQIAASLKISIKTVETQMSRALLRLRKQLAHHLPVLLSCFITTLKFF